MNKTRRAELQRAIELIDKARDLIDNVVTEEEEAYENLPENLQNSERGEQMQEYMYALGGVIDRLDEVIDDITEVTEG